MKKIVRLTESDLVRLVKKVIKEQGVINHEEKMMDTVWKPMLSALGSTSNKHIKMNDGDYSLNWGSHSGPGYDWGMSISKKGTFNFQTKDPKKQQMMMDLISKYDIPFDVTERPTFSVYANPRKYSIYDYPSDEFIQFIKEVLSKMKKS